MENVFQDFWTWIIIAWVGGDGARSFIFRGQFINSSAQIDRKLWKCETTNFSNCTHLVHLFSLYCPVKILTSTFSEGHHGFDFQREHFDPYTRHTVMPKFSRPATAPSRPKPEAEPEQISNTYSDTSPDRDNDTRARGRPSIKRKVLRYGSGFRRLV